MFPQILNDLKFPAGSLGKQRGAKYKIYSLVQPIGADLFDDVQPDFVIRSEEYGIPQSRHRVILLGIRTDIKKVPRQLKKHTSKVNTWDVIKDLPKIRSGISKNHGEDDWERVIEEGFEKIVKESFMIKAGKSEKVRWLESYRKIKNRGSRFIASPTQMNRKEDELSRWYYDTKLGGVVNHESRSHIARDLWRYLYSSLFTRVHNGVSPRTYDFPKFLVPAHANWGSGKFTDRFKVQASNKPSSTITSHISKDGHYFIHPDPAQVRSLTVREAARLQTFPDNYFFEGNRTEQYTQVGNAVPPFLAKQIAEIVHGVLT
jgi:DNA (cytosine-5)-methyltransferase 1